MPPAALIDTGCILAILEVDDRWHRASVEALQFVRIPLFTTEAVLTEMFHLVGKKSNKTEKAWDFVRSGALTIRPMYDADLPVLRELMYQYKDRPMDFADATLVHLAAQESISLILTIDHDEFETYRIEGKKRFNILPRRRY